MVVLLMCLGMSMSIFLCGIYYKRKKIEYKSHGKYTPLQFQFFKNNTQADKIFRVFQSQWFHEQVKKN